MSETIMFCFSDNNADIQIKSTNVCGKHVKVIVELNDVRNFVMCIYFNPNQKSDVLQKKTIHFK